MDENKQARIRALNDNLRRTFTGGRVVTTASVAALDPDTKAAVLANVAAFDKFTGDNDPHGEHDFGSFEWEGCKYFWKIDYYNTAMDAGSPDPSDPKQTTRVLTIMLAVEY